MMDVGSALSVAEQHFPLGPEKLAEQLGVRWWRTPLDGAAGWCIPTSSPVIVLNANDPSTRQRFTLAHELAHLVRGTPGLELTRDRDLFTSDAQEEREANELAASLLMPLRWLEAQALQAPIGKLVLNKLAAEANVSVPTLMYRIANCAAELGFSTITVLRFDGEHLKSQFPPVNVSDELAGRLLSGAKSTSNGIFRQPLTDGSVALGTLIENPAFYTTVFVQIVSAQVATLPSADEYLDRCKRYLFQDETRFVQKFGGCLGSFKSKNAEHSMPLEHAVHQFLEQYAGKWHDPEHEVRLRTEMGLAWLRYRLSKWYH
ncbi:ImmA/IrrE family metallo-endopeptidase [Phycisphaerales bacterium AB-hyl4]|uniref:ImmA/IrrE family metallo-endopeptidase n=1 Tax=Natronomicrosphaera hydrolytica TaxID=3242702 RepID=A0ABV4U9Z2_9BACT